MAPVFFYAILLYVLYRLIDGLIIPVYKTSKQFKQQFDNMRTTAQATKDPWQESPGKKSAETAAPRPAPPSSDYIDFEEIK